MSRIWYANPGCLDNGTEKGAIQKNVFKERQTVEIARDCDFILT
jgi:hypothetical protein